MAASVCDYRPATTCLLTRLSLCCPFRHSTVLLVTNGHGITSLARPTLGSKLCILHVGCCKTACLPVLQDVQVLTSAEYFAQYWGHVPVVWDLYDSIQQSRQAAAAEGSPSRSAGSYKPYWSSHTLEQALNSGTAFQVNTYLVMQPELSRVGVVSHSSKALCM